jgi:hypothetical protein
LYFLHCQQQLACLPQLVHSRHNLQSAYVSIRQHTSACVCMRQHTSAYVSMHQHTSSAAATCSIVQLIAPTYLSFAARQG